MNLQLRRAIVISAALPVRYGHPEFYSVAAQVIPVLLLALILEDRSLASQRVPALARVALVTVVGGLFVLSEGIALHVLYVGYAHRQDQDWVIFPLVVGAVVLLLPVALRALFELDQQRRNIQFWLGTVWFAIVTTVVSVGLIILFRY